MCYGYAKAYALLLSMEGLDVKRVVAQEKNDTGRSGFNFNAQTGQYTEYHMHSYNYVKINGFDYLSDVTYSCAGRVTFGSVNVDEEEALAIQYGVSVIPTLFFLKKGVVVNKTVGVRPESELTSILEDMLK